MATKHTTEKVQRRTASSGATWVIVALVAAAGIIVVLFFSPPERSRQSNNGVSTTADQSAPFADNATMQEPGAGSAPQPPSGASTSALATSDTPAKTGAQQTSQ